MAIRAGFSLGTLIGEDRSFGDSAAADRRPVRLDAADRHGHQRLPAARRSTARRWSSRSRALGWRLGGSTSRASRCPTAWSPTSPTCRLRHLRARHCSAEDGASYLSFSGGLLIALPSGPRGCAVTVQAAALPRRRQPVARRRSSSTASSSSRAEPRRARSRRGGYYRAQRRRRHPSVGVRLHRHRRLRPSVTAATRFGVDLLIGHRRRHRRPASTTYGPGVLSGRRSVRSARSSYAARACCTRATCCRSCATVDRESRELRYYRWYRDTRPADGAGRPAACRLAGRATTRGRSASARRRVARRRSGKVVELDRVRARRARGPAERGAARRRARCSR